MVAVSFFKPTFTYIVGIILPIFPSHYLPFMKACFYCALLALGLTAFPAHAVTYICKASRSPHVGCVPLARTRCLSI
ncbi:Uncharacterised protein [Neisseria animaloris]|uniref:Uncharacterized protein n=1 Tax=Neisseria animaloris TaxID=326522 RepID=A0A448UEC8_9NEIS|nr:Uncharacterised protein [Neisseria animaloris]